MLMKAQRSFRFALLILVILLGLVFSFFGSSAQVGNNTSRPSEIDVRGPFGVPKGTALRLPTAVQTRALGALQRAVGAPLQVDYNGLTATPRHIYSFGTYLTPPSSAPPETIARNFISRWREIFRFSDSDLSNLRLKS